MQKITLKIKVKINQPKTPQNQITLADRHKVQVKNLKKL